jgi:hypothetical protein
MKSIELVNNSIQKTMNKLSEKAIIAAQSIAKELDDALANGYEIEWRLWPIENSKSFDVVNVGNKPDFVCRIYDENTWNEVVCIFDNATVKMEGHQVLKFADLMELINQAINH